MAAREHRGKTEKGNGKVERRVQTLRASMLSDLAGKGYCKSA